MQYHKDIHEWNQMSLLEQKQHQAQKDINDKHIESLQREYGEAAEKTPNDPYSIFQSINAQYGQATKVPTAEENFGRDSDSSDASIPEEFKHFTSDIGREEDYITTDHELNEENVQEHTVNRRPYRGSDQNADSQAYLKDFDRSIYTQQNVKEDYYLLQNDLERQRVDWSGPQSPTKMYFQGFMSSTNDQIIDQINCNELENKQKVQLLTNPELHNKLGQGRLNTFREIDQISRNGSTTTQRSPISDYNN